jgi:hypothetical protein
MGVKRQQGKGDQKDLLDEALKASLRHGVSGEGGSGTGTREEQQAHTARAEGRALTQPVMEEVTRSSNLNQALRSIRERRLTAGKKTNIARCINHSCRPNCEIEIWRGRIYVMAKRAINPSEELFYDYDTEYFNEHIRPKRPQALQVRCGWEMSGPRRLPHMPADEARIRRERGKHEPSPNHQTTHHMLFRSRTRYVPPEERSVQGWFCATSSAGNVTDAAFGFRVAEQNASVGVDHWSSGECGFIVVV